MELKLFIYPNKYKVFFLVILLIPITILALALANQYGIYEFGDIFSIHDINISLFFIIFFIGILFSYFISCFLDKISNIKIKNFISVIIAIFVSIFVLVFVNFFIKKMSYGAISEYAHIPSECELACREIMENVTNRTAEISQKFQECMQNCYK